MKTLTYSEKKFLLQILPDYVGYMRSHRETLLPWFLGMFVIIKKSSYF